MRQNITVSLEANIIQQASELAAQRHPSISALLTETLTKLVASNMGYQQAKRHALALLEQAPLDLGGDYLSREQAHARRGKATVFYQSSPGSPAENNT